MGAGNNWSILTVAVISKLFTGDVHALDPGCQSTIGWTDANGDNCLVYVSKCEQRGGWPKLLETDPEYFNRLANNGITAQDACCQCGKGAADAVLSNSLRLTRLSECVSFSKAWS